MIRVSQLWTLNTWGKNKTVKTFNANGLASRLIVIRSTMITLGHVESRRPLKHCERAAPGVRRLLRMNLLEDRTPCPLGPSDAAAQTTLQIDELQT